MLIFLKYCDYFDLKKERPRLRCERNHRENKEARIKEIIYEKGLKWLAIFADYPQDAPSYIQEHFKRITSPGGLRKVPYTKEMAIKKDTMLKEDFFRYLENTYLTEEEADIRVFVQNNAPEEVVEILRKNYWGEDTEE